MWITRAGRLPDLVGILRGKEPAMQGGYWGSPGRQNPEMWAIHPFPKGSGSANGPGIAQETNV